MKINMVSVTYGRLKSKGFQSYSNERYELTLGAVLQEGESAEVVRVILTNLARSKVDGYFDRDKPNDPMDVPF